MASLTSVVFTRCGPHQEDLALISSQTKRRRRAAANNPKNKSYTFTQDDD
jgi:hypothetical protein